MTDVESGAFELNHRGRIHRASDFNQLLKWVKEYRVTSKDSFRAAGTDEWIPVMSRREFASILNPDNQWLVSMKSGIFRAPTFDVVTQWAKEGRISTDAIVEGPRTPPGGVNASALPALAPHLKVIPDSARKAVHLRIDGREYLAPDTDTIRVWIRESRVPVEAVISLDGETWDSISSCGLFDLEEWPKAAHGPIEEEALPEMPTGDQPSIVKSASGTQEPPSMAEEDSLDEKDEEPAEDNGSDKNEKAAGEVPYSIVTGETDITVESIAELKRLLRKRLIFSYDEIRHPSITEDSLSVGEFLENRRKLSRRRSLWIWALPAAAVIAAALDLTGTIEIVPWF